MRFRERFEAVLGAGMVLPDALGRLYDWIESEALVVDDPDDGPVGLLFPRDRLAASWTETERAGGTLITFTPRGARGLGHWFGTDDPGVLGRLSVFAQTGADGSQAALWRDDDGHQRVVHLGSGSGSTLTCVLADDPVDFLRLVAIGYDEICWGHLYDAPPPTVAAPDAPLVLPNEKYRQWVRSSFDVDVPTRGRDVVRDPCELDDPDPTDPFARWIRSVSR